MDDHSRDARPKPGEYTDAETGFTYLRARYYDPGTGQFISRDPLTAMTGSPYTYVDGNPLNAVDPTGLYTDLFGGGSESMVRGNSSTDCLTGPVSSLTLLPVRRADLILVGPGRVDSSKPSGEPLDPEEEKFLVCTTLNQFTRNGILYIEESCFDTRTGQSFSA
ncbi:MAG: RHS repeat-associated core domain-containing protein [Acidimicrobiales bacterium]